MSKFLSKKYQQLDPYTPGEQPRDMKYIKLNTNESPFPPSKKAKEAAAEEIEKLQLYSDPECTALVSKLAEVYKVDTKEVICANGSDEVLNFAFMAYCDEKQPAVFADITYGFYPVFAAINMLPSEIIPLNDDFTLDIEAFKKSTGTLFIANPNAPTGIALTADQIEDIVKSRPNRVVVVDEAYVDFGAQSCVPLIHKYDNLLVTQTFSKSRSMAGARLGFAIGCEALINDLNRIRYSTNPYNVNRMTMAAGVGSLTDQQYMIDNCHTIMDNRSYTMNELRKLGFSMTDSMANFIFASHPDIPGEELYLRLKEKGVLVRHFGSKRICEYNRITVGTRQQMDILLQTIRDTWGSTVLK